VNSVLRALLTSLILALVGAGAAAAQSFDFSLLLLANGQAFNIPNNGPAIDIIGALNTQTTVTVKATYTGTTEATISQPPVVLGSTEFKVVLVNPPPFPIVLTPGQVLTFTVTYLPTSVNLASMNVSIAYTEPGTGATQVSNAISLTFQGGSPSFSLSYFVTPANGVTPNFLPIASGGLITFPATLLNATTTGGLEISNIGSAAGQITGISLVSGSPFFQLAGVPPLTPANPYTLTPNTSTATLSIGILYTPTKVETDTGQILITYLDGSTATINLTGNGITSAFTYSYISGTTVTPVAPKGTITFLPVPVAAVGTTPGSSTVIVQVKNTGAASGTISSISVSGPGFQVVGGLTTAQTIPAGGTFSFTLSFTPTQVGPQIGTLAVGSDTFTLSGTGSGPALTFSYVSSGTTISVPAGGTVDFVPVAISQSETLTFIVTNSGTSPATIPLIAVNPTPPFSLTPTPPALPLTLAAGKSSQFTITFTPTTTGTVTGTLLINSTTVQLAGSGNAPPALPSYTITGPSGNVSPASQQNVSLTLAKSYPVDLNGVLTLTTSGTFGTDPAVQFSTGSSAGNRTVDFVIPAGSTSANFAGQGSQILVQTGTVAETVTLKPTFATSAGVSLTPTSPESLQFTIASSAPVLESVGISGETPSSFTLVIVGYSTTRSLGTLTVTFNAAPGFNLATTQFPTDLSQLASVWFQSTASQGLGGLFQVSLPFNLTGTVPTGKTLIETIASVAATISNSIGTSTSQQVNVQ
jgi:Abnormal spindle-like microcephaly-assoc'd, ASPM-SPD-2-Hydin